MRKIGLLSSLLIIMVLLPWIGLSQKAEWVEQVIIANGNRYETTPPFVDYVTMQTYDPNTGLTSVFDQINSQSVQDVIIANNKIYVAAQDSIVMYDATTLERLGSIVDSGLSRLYVFNNFLIVTKQYPIVRFFAEVLSASDLSIVARIQNLSGDCKGITQNQDSIYIAVNGGFQSTEGKLAVINVNNWTVAREIALGPNIAGINDIYTYAGIIYCINETPFGSSDIGSISAYNTFNKLVTNFIFDLNVGNGAGGVKNSGIIDNLLYLTLNNGIGSFNMNTFQIQDTSIFPDPGFVDRIVFTSFTTDYVNSLLYMNLGNRVSFGLDIIGTTSGDSITFFDTGTNSDAIAIDYRVPVGIQESSSENASVSIYPNPAEDHFLVKYSGEAQVSEILIRDITGRTIYKSNERSPLAMRIDCSSYPAGLYFLTLKTNSKTISSKFIKK